LSKSAASWKVCESIYLHFASKLTVCLVPVNLKDRDAFHLTIEDYLLALTNTIEELARLAPNSVTLGDYGRPLQISKFIKDIHAGFQLLNLKNDALRRRSDTIKYSVREDLHIPARGTAIWRQLCNIFG
jgi:predicted translin family RNA/ssDNA-binding protein